MNKYLYSLLLLSYFSIKPASFSDQWKAMQQEYRFLSQKFNSQDSKLEANYMHPYWKKQKKSMADLINGKEDPNFLLRSPIAGPMVRNEWSKTQDYEVIYLQYCIKDSTRKLIQSFQDTQFGGLSFRCKEFNCSINTLGQLFFFVKLLERNNFENVQTIVELGGGYGCLARVAKKIKPETTYVLFDLPEYLAIQSFYLRSTLTNTEVIIHNEVPKYFKPGAIHLVPVFFLPDIDIKADLFVSAFALSETPKTVQLMVINKKFFHATSVCLTGQLNRWGTQHNFEHHKTVFDGMHLHYKFCFAQPLHHFGGHLNSYEIYGTNIVQK